MGGFPAYNKTFFLCDSLCSLCLCGKIFSFAQDDKQKPALTMTEPLPGDIIKTYA